MASVPPGKLFLSLDRAVTPLVNLDQGKLDYRLQAFEDSSAALGHTVVWSPRKAFEVSHEALSLRRTEVAKAERCFSMPAGLCIRIPMSLECRCETIPTRKPVSAKFDVLSLPKTTVTLLAIAPKGKIIENTPELSGIGLCSGNFHFVHLAAWDVRWEP